MNGVNSERNKLIYERHNNGETLMALAEEYGITKARVQQIYTREDIKKRMEETEDPLTKLMYKYSKNGTEFYMLSHVFKDNNIKTIFDLDAVLIRDLNIKHYYVSDERSRGLIAQIKRKVHVIIKKG